MNRKQRRAAKSQGKAAPGCSAPAAAADSPGPIAQRFALALAHHQAGRLDQAESLYRQICTLEPGHVESLYLLAVLARQGGRNEVAIDLIGRVLALRPDFAQAHHDLGAILLVQDKPDEAIACLERAVALKPDYAEAHYNQGIALMRVNRLTDAARCYERALALAPDFADAHNGLGALLLVEDKPAEALACFERALALKPDHLEALNNRGSVLRNLKRLAPALASYDLALAIKPDYAEAHYNRGNVLLGLMRPAEALLSFERALAIKPDYAQALHNRGNALRILQRHAQALASFDQAVAINQDYAETRWNRACLRLLLADFERGWKEYEWRWKTQEFASGRRDFAQPQWRGEEPLAGRTILLHAEQGYGDAIQFVRYAPLVAALGAKVILEVPRPLTALFSRIAGVSLVIGRGDKLPELDCHCPLVGLPLAFKTRLETIPASTAYLSAARDRVIKWRQRLPQPRARRIGIAWAGNPAFAGDQTRSIGLTRFSPLLSVAGVEFLSLQRDLREGDRDILRSHSHVLQVGDPIEDFDDAAAIMSSVDLVISSDTSVAHLAGAMGKPVWVLLQYDADWRWLVGRSDSPWYPTARLFRQPGIDDWESVVARLIGELRTVVAA
jgi:tetratricopeptide (TPR) repeat protein